MQVEKIKSHLELVTNVAVILVAVALLSALSWGFFIQRQSPTLMEGLQKNQTIAKLPAVDYSAAPHTLLIALSTKCHFCKEGIPFYNKLAKSQQGKNRVNRIIAIFPDEEGEVREYVQQNQLQIETVSAVNYEALGLNATPTMILVNEDGTVLDFWVGKLSEETEKQAFELVTAQSIDVTNLE